MHKSWPTHAHNLQSCWHCCSVHAAIHTLHAHVMHGMHRTHPDVEEGPSQELNRYALLYRNCMWSKTVTHLVGRGEQLAGGGGQHRKELLEGQEGAAQLKVHPEL